MHLPAKVNSLFVQTFMANKIPSDSESDGDRGPPGGRGFPGYKGHIFK